MGNETLVHKFIEKFNSDRRTFAEKLKAVGIARDTWATIKYNRRVPKKKTVEAMRAYLENRPPKYDLVTSPTEFYCCTCEKGVPISRRHDQWTCKSCCNVIRYRSRKKNWDVYLVKKKTRNLKLKYGSFATCMRTIIDIKKELRQYEQEEKTTNV